MNIQEKYEKLEKAKQFIEEILGVCRKFNLSISHEDGHGTFLIEEYNDYDADWLGYSVEDLEKAKQFIEEILGVCRKFNLSISHEDGHRTFLIEEYNDYDADWLGYSVEDYEYKLQKEIDKEELNEQMV
jgi:quinol monooxygenase YgiN